jgi:hypothetical protein
VLGLREGEEELPAARARVPLSKFVREAVTLIGSWNRKNDRHEPEHFEREFARTVAPAVEPGKRIPDDYYKEVARVYRYAARLGKPPTAAVAKAFDVSRSTAGRYVVETRRRGFLGPALPGVAGELDQEESNG